LLSAYLILVAVQVGGHFWMTVEYNRCYGTVLFPAFFLLIVLVSVFSNYIILTPGSDMLSKVYCSATSGGLAVLTVLVIQDATYFPTDSRAAILSGSGALRKRIGSFAHNATLISCPTIKIFVNNFFYLDQELMPMLLSITIQPCVKLLRFHVRVNE